MRAIVLKSLTESVVIEPHSAEPNDIGAVRCSIQLEAKGFLKASAEHWFYLSDLEEFYKCLEAIDRDLAGAASLKSFEGGADIKVASQRGQLEVEAGVSLDNELGHVRFTFRSDQSFLRQYLSEC